MNNQKNIAHVVEEVTIAFNRYEKALTTNNIEVLDELFLHSDETIRYGVSEDLYGYREIEEFRKNRPSKGLDRMLSRTVITSYGDSTAIANTEFLRVSEARIGRQSQTWVKFDQGWRIVAAHVSLMEK